MDIDGSLAVWWEANGADVISDAHIYAMRLPDGPKVEVASGTSVAYPQVTKGMITWVEGKPWATEPDAWWDYTIKAASIDADGQPTGSAITLVDYGSAIAATLGDSTWSYSLSDGYLAWEQQSDAGVIGIGSYVMDLGPMEPWNVDSDAWRPSLYKERVVLTLNGVSYADFLESVKTLDGAGDFATAAPTYAAYYRPTPSGDGTSWAVVAKGYTGKHEQVLLDDTGNPPWFLAPIATSGHHVAFTLDGDAAPVHLAGVAEVRLRPGRAAAQPAPPRPSLRDAGHHAHLELEPGVGRQTDDLHGAARRPVGAEVLGLHPVDGVLVGGDILDVAGHEDHVAQRAARRRQQFLELLHGPAGLPLGVVRHVVELLGPVRMVMVGRRGHRRREEQPAAVDHDRRRVRQVVARVVLRRCG